MTEILKAHPDCFAEIDDMRDLVIRAKQSNHPGLSRFRWRLSHPVRPALRELAQKPVQVRHEVPAMLKIGRPRQWAGCAVTSGARYFLTVNGTENWVFSHFSFSTPPPESFFSMTMVN